MCRQTYALCGLGLAALLLISSSGCRRDSGAGTGAGGIAPNPAAPALYGPARGVPSRMIAAGQLTPPPVSGQPGSFSIVQTELSPALLLRCGTRQVDLFAPPAVAGLGAPASVAWTTSGGPRIFKSGEPLDIAVMRENWILVWWAGSEGWTNWDSPWVIYLQHKPDTMALDRDGLHLDFPAPAGDIVLMPLYGYDKLPAQGRDPAAEHGVAGRKLKTWEWPKVLPRDPLTRIRYWSSVTREIPIRCEETFSVDRAKDQLTVRSRFDWHSIADDWRTPHLRLAPLSPPLGQVLTDGKFPATLSRRWFDLDYPTPYGPLLAVEGADEFEVTFRVLHYLNETEAAEPRLNPAQPVVRAAGERLRRVLEDRFPAVGASGLGKGASPAQFLEDLCAAGWLARALPYAGQASAARAGAALGKFWREDVLLTNRFLLAAGSGAGGQPFRVLAPPGQDRATALEAGRRNAAMLLDGLWAYAHFTGDWGLARERWPLLRSTLIPASRMRWVGLDQNGAGAIGEDAGACIAFARLAYQAGDLDAYNYGAYLLARALTQDWVRQRGTDYFRKHQPWHSLEWMDEEVFPGALGTGTTGWLLDGPHYPAAGGSRLFEQRWARFRDVDVARFHRDHLATDVRSELNWLQHRSQPALRWTHDPAGVPSLVQLRSDLLKETPAQLAEVADVERLAGPPGGVVASCLALLRADQPVQMARLIPPGEPSPFVTGGERETALSNPELVVTLDHGSGKPAGELERQWPKLTWERWQDPRGGSWTFGELRGWRGPAPGQPLSTRFNWNTRLISYGSP